MDVASPQNSTIVLFNEMKRPSAWRKPDWRLTALRAGMRILGRLSPGLAAHAMDRLWFAAQRTKPTAEASAWLDRASPMDLRVHDNLVRAWSWGDGPTILLVHGWGGHGAQLHAFVEPLVRSGYRVVAFDAPAHGASGPSRLGGRRVSFFEIAAALRAVAAASGPIAAVIAHSGGCAATAMAIREGWQPPGALVFVAPFALPSGAIDGFAQAVGASSVTTTLFRAGVERRFARPWTDFDIPTLPAELKHGRMLVIHDAEDREVPFLHGQAVVESWPGAQLQLTHGLGHRRLLQDRSVLDRVTGFLGPANGERQQPVPADARHELDLAYETSGCSSRHRGG